MMKLPLLFALAGTFCGAAWAQTDSGSLPKPITPATGEANPQGSPSLEPMPQGEHAYVSGEKHAQGGPSLEPISPTQEHTYQISLKNVKPSLMAYWIDPENNQPPGNASVPSPFSGQTKQGKFSLPTGVSRIVAVDPQNALLVFGTEEGATSIANIVRLLDRPLRQVEIGARIFQVASDQLEKLGLNFTTTATPSSIRVTANIEVPLATLQQQKQAFLLASPQITAINNLTADLKSENVSQVTLGISDSKGTLSPFYKSIPPTGNGGETALTVHQSQLLQVTPTINNDGTITLLAQGGQKSELQGANGTADAIVLERQQMPETIINARDGETIAFKELPFPSQGHTSAFTTIILLTARIVKKAGN